MPKALLSEVLVLLKLFPNRLKIVRLAISHERNNTIHSTKNSAAADPLIPA